LAVFRPFSKGGTLKDLIHSNKPTNPKPYQQRYDQLSGTPLTESKIAKFGKMILEGLDYLAHHNISFFNLHSGNVVIENSVCYLTDMENDFIGLPPRNLAILHSHINRSIDPVVVAFGCVLYEMSVGYEMDNWILDDLPKDCPKPVVKILKSIFDTTSSEAPSLRDIINTPLFSAAILYSDWSPEEIQTSNKDKSNQMITDAKNKMLDMIKTKSDKNFITTAPVATSTSDDPKKRKRNKKRESNAIPAPPPPTPLAPPPPPLSSTPSATGERRDWLSSMETFSNKKLKKAVTNDRSAPKV